MVNKIFLVLLVSVVLFGHAGSVLALGQECGVDNDCSNITTEKCCCCPATGCTNATNAKLGVCGNKSCSIICPFSAHTSLEQLIKGITDFIFNLGIIIAPLMIVIGGFVFLTSGGEPNRTSLGKNIMKWSIIGLAIILFAWGIQSVIKFILVGSPPPAP